MKIKIVLCLALQLSASYSFAYIYRIYALRRWSETLQKYQYVIGLSDYHDKRHQANENQRAMIEYMLTSIDHDTMKLVVEDLSSTNSCGIKGCGRFKINSRGGILGGLAEVGQKHAIDTANIEYRFCRVAGFGPILNNLDKPISSLQSTNLVSMQALYNEVLHELESLEREVQDAYLHSLCTKKCKQIMKEMNDLRFVKNKRLSAGTYFLKYMRRAKGDEKQAFSNRLFMFDSDVLDFKLVNEVLNSDKEIIVTVAGGTHIKHMDALLSEVGFEQMYVSAKSKQQEYDLSRCLGSHIFDGKYCVKPEPIDLKEIEEYFNEDLK